MILSSLINLILQQKKRREKRERSCHLSSVANYFKPSLVLYTAAHYFGTCYLGNLLLCKSINEFTSSMFPTAQHVVPSSHTTFLQLNVIIY